MLLTAWAEGVGSNFVGFGGLDKAKALLGVPASLGVRDPAVRVPDARRGQGQKQRKPLRQVAHLKRYGRPFE